MQFVNVEYRTLSIKIEMVLIWYIVTRKIPTACEKRPVPIFMSDRIRTNPGEFLVPLYKRQFLALFSGRIPDIIAPCIFSVTFHPYTLQLRMFLKGKIKKRTGEFIFALYQFDT